MLETGEGIKMSDCYTVLENKIGSKKSRKTRIGRCISKKDATKVQKAMTKAFGDKYQYEIRKDNY